MDGDKFTIVLERDGKRYQLVDAKEKISCKRCVFNGGLLDGRCPRSKLGVCLCMRPLYGIWKEVKEMNEEYIYEYATQAKYGEYWFTLGEDSESLSQTKEKIKRLRALNPHHEWRIVRRQVAITWEEVKE